MVRNGIPTLSTQSALIPRHVYRVEVVFDVVHGDESSELNDEFCDGKIIKSTYMGSLDEYRSAFTREEIALAALTERESEMSDID